MQSFRRSACAVAAATAALALIVTAAGCRGSASSETPVIGTYRIGERVQVGPLVYNTLQADWKAELEGGKTPKHRFLVIKVSITNSGGDTVSVPGFALLDKKGATVHELTEGLENVSGRLSMLRMIAPGQSEIGSAIFDVPLGEYKLVASDGGEIGKERHAHIEIPVSLDDPVR